MIEIWHSLIITGEPTHTASKQWHHAPHLRIYHLKRNVSLPAIFSLLCSSTNLQLFKRISAIKVATMKITEISITNGSLPQNRNFLWRAQINGTQRRALVSPWRMHCMYSGTAKGTSRAEVTLNSEKIKPVVLAIVELRKSGRQWVN